MLISKMCGRPPANRGDPPSAALRQVRHLATDEQLEGFVRRLVSLDRPVFETEGQTHQDLLAQLRRQFGSSPKSYTNSVNFGIKLSLYGMLICSSAASVLSGFWPLQVVGTLGLGLMFVHGVELQHQALHGLGFRNHYLNEVTGVLLGLPFFTSFAGYEATHLRHHLFLGTPQNKETFDYGNDQYGERSRKGIASLWRWFVRFSMARHYSQFIMNLWRSVLSHKFPNETDKVSRRMRRDYLIMGAAFVLSSIASIMTGIPLVLLLWLAPLVLVAGPMHALIELPEHYQCDIATTDVFKNTRSIHSNPFMTWLTNSNNYHVEHHLLPRLAIERLPDLHEVIAPYICHHHESYSEFFASLFARKPWRAQSATPEASRDAD